MPDSKARLISPQWSFNKCQGITGKFTGTEEHASLEFDGLPPLKIDFDINSHLPTGLAKNQSQFVAPIQANMAILSEENQNLTPSQKLLLERHFRFGHKSMQYISEMYLLSEIISKQRASVFVPVVPRANLQKDIVN